MIEAETNLSNLRPIGQEGGRMFVDVAKGTGRRLTDEDILRTLRLLSEGPEMFVLGSSLYKRADERIKASSF